MDRLFCFLVLSGPLFFHFDALWKGQVVKQFFTYSIVESLYQRPFQFLSSTLPCIPSRTFVEEVPVFHQIAAAFVSLGTAHSWIVPYIVFLLLALSVFRLARFICPSQSSWVVTGVVMSIPAFQRYSIQMMPDLFATMALCFGVGFLLSKRPLVAVFFLSLAAMAKFLTAFAAIPIWLYAVYTQKSRKHSWMLSSFAGLFFIVMPFIIWLALISILGIPSPFSFKHLLTNRHSGDFSLLFSLDYFARIQTWLGPKGIGIILWIAVVARVLMSANRRWLSLPFLKSTFSSHGLLTVWCCSVVPYVLLVREGNRVHDYYVLPFLVAFSILGLRIFDHPWIARRIWLSRSIIGLHAILGVGSGFALQPISNSASDIRPTFCDYEQPPKIP